MNPDGRPQLLVILGSGFSESLGLPGTTALTAAARRFGRPITVGGFDRPAFVTVGEALWRMATSYYQSPNFETMLHLVETMLSMPKGAAWLGTDDARKPAFGAFANIMPQWLPVLEQTGPLREFGEAMMNVVADELVAATERLTDDSIGRARAFLAGLAEHYHLIIVTLNYDDVVERCFPQYTDGFLDDDVASFAPSRLLDAPDVPELIHLHGSVRFAVRRGDGHVEILRCRTAGHAKEIGRWSVAVGTQAGEEVYVGPMVSGYRKSEKLALAPYGYYYWRLTDAIMRCPRAVVVGYGAGDTYLNRWLQEFTRQHGADRRLAIVTKRNRGDAITGGVMLAAGILNPRLGVADIDGPRELDAITGNGLWAGHETVHSYVDGLPFDDGATQTLVQYLQTGDSGRRFLPPLA
jgi:hypothetical protein